MLISERSGFSYTGGALERYRKRADSGREIDLVRCAACGVRLWHEPLSAPELVFIAAGTLHDSSWVVPASHIFIEKASAGAHLHADALCIEGQPTDRHVLFDAFERLYPP